MSGLTAATLNTAGVQQGDPFGPAGFALALHSLVEKLQDTVSPQVWHLDDSHILATRLQLHAAITEIQRQGTPLGIPLNPKKNAVCGILEHRKLIKSIHRRQSHSCNPSGSPMQPNSGICALGLPVSHKVGVLLKKYKLNGPLMHKKRAGSFGICHKPTSNFVCFGLCWMHVKLTTPCIQHRLNRQKTHWPSKTSEISTRN